MDEKKCEVEKGELEHNQAPHPCVGIQTKRIEANHIDSKYILNTIQNEMENIGNGIWPRRCSQGEPSTFWAVFSHSRVI